MSMARRVAVVCFLMAMTAAGPYGLVKFQGKAATMLLTKVITDGKDKITGSPQPFNPMMFGQPDQQHP